MECKQGTGKSRRHKGVLKRSDALPAFYFTVKTTFNRFSKQKHGYGAGTAMEPSIDFFVCPILRGVPADAGVSPCCRRVVSVIDWDAFVERDRKCVCGEHAASGSWHPLPRFMKVVHANFEDRFCQVDDDNNTVRYLRELVVEHGWAMSDVTGGPIIVWCEDEKECSPSPRILRQSRRPILWCKRDATILTFHYSADPIPCFVRTMGVESLFRFDPRCSSTEVQSYLGRQCFRGGVGLCDRSLDGVTFVAPESATGSAQSVIERYTKQFFESFKFVSSMISAWQTDGRPCVVVSLLSDVFVPLDEPELPLDLDGVPVFYTVGVWRSTSGIILSRFCRDDGVRPGSAISSEGQIEFGSLGAFLDPTTIVTAAHVVHAGDGCTVSHPPRFAQNVARASFAGWTMSQLLDCLEDENDLVLHDVTKDPGPAFAESRLGHVVEFRPTVSGQPHLHIDLARCHIDGASSLSFLPEESHMKWLDRTFRQSVSRDPEDWLFRGDRLWTEHGLKAWLRMNRKLKVFFVGSTSGIRSKYIVNELCIAHVRKVADRIRHYLAKDSSTQVLAVNPPWEKVIVVPGLPIQPGDSGGMCFTIEKREDRLVPKLIGVVSCKLGFALAGIAPCM